MVRELFHYCLHLQGRLRESRGDWTARRQKQSRLLQRLQTAYRLAWPSGTARGGKTLCRQAAGARAELHRRAIRQGLPVQIPERPRTIYGGAATRRSSRAVTLHYWRLRARRGGNALSPVLTPGI